MAGIFEKITFENDVRTLKEELGAADERRIAGFYEQYRKAVESDLRALAESDGVECVSVLGAGGRYRKCQPCKDGDTGRAKSDRGSDRFGEKKDRSLLWSGRTGH